MPSKQELAGLLYYALVDAKRNDGTPYVRLEDGSPDWMRDAIREAHAGMLPDDTKYHMILEVASVLENAEDWDDIDEELDGLVDVYTYELTEWLHSHPGYRQQYCDNALRDFGTPANYPGMFQILQMGQMAEYHDIAATLSRFLSDMTEETEENDNA